MKENKNHGDVRVLVSGGHDVQVVVLDEGVTTVLGADERRQGAVLLPVGNQANELVDDGVVDVAAVIPGYDDLALHVKEVNCRQSHLDPEILAL
jgi:hypothetical protein